MGTRAGKARLVLFAEVEVTTILVAVIVAMGPTLLAIANARTAARARREDWARQDDVAAKAAEQARLLAERQDAAERNAQEVARTLAETNRRVAAEAAQVRDKLDENGNALAEVHVLVNSKLTESLAAQATILSQMVELMSGDIVRLGTDADPAAVARRDVALKELRRLREVLADREAAVAAAAPFKPPAVIPPSPVPARDDRP